MGTKAYQRGSARKAKGLPHLQTTNSFPGKMKRFLGRIFQIHEQGIVDLIDFF
jgi:hypothetical protein